jgi:hypothetical protein
MDRFVFPRWTNKLVLILPILVLLGGLYLVVLVVYAVSPQTTDVGYQPKQPVPYSHALHVGQLGLDCRYCHTTVEYAAHAALPPTQTCMNCHKTIRADSPKLLPVRESYASGKPIEWIRVHDLPGFVYFNHSAHVRRGVGCVSCHGRIDQMDEVYQAKPLSMGWCLDCHRNPESALRPEDKITSMDWTPPGDPVAFGKRIRTEEGLNPSTDCWTCHR